MNDLASSLNRIRKGALLVGVAASVICILGGIGQGEQFFRSYLLAYTYWIQFPLGCMTLSMLSHLSGGKWAELARRPLEASARTIWLLALLVLPLLVAIPVTYPWAGREAPHTDQALYLNIPAFVIRTVIYFVAWAAFTFPILRASRLKLTERARTLSGPGILVFGFAITFSGIDWIMSLEHDWYSTMFGVILTLSQALGGAALTIGASLLLLKFEPLSRIAPQTRNKVFVDLGNILLALVMTWTYVAFMQYLIIWSGDLPEEVRWFVHRNQGGWQGVIFLVAIFQFAAPFLFLLFRRSKERTGILFFVACLVLVIRWLDAWWTVTPSFYPDGIHLHWMDVLLSIGMGGLWVAAFASHLAAQPILEPDSELLLGVR